MNREKSMLRGTEVGKLVMAHVWLMLDKTASESPLNSLKEKLKMTNYSSVMDSLHPTCSGLEMINSNQFLVFSKLTFAHSVLDF